MLSTTLLLCSLLTWAKDNQVNTFELPGAALHEQHPFYPAAPLYLWSNRLGPRQDYNQVLPIWVGRHALELGGCSQRNTQLRGLN